MTRFLKAKNLRKTNLFPFTMLTSLAGPVRTEWTGLGTVKLGGKAPDNVK